MAPFGVCVRLKEKSQQISVTCGGKLVLRSSGLIIGVSPDPIEPQSVPLQSVGT